MTTIRVYIESWNDQHTDEYTLDPEEQARWDAMSPAERERYVDDFGQTAFVNACNYSAQVVE